MIVICNVMTHIIISSNSIEAGTSEMGAEKQQTNDMEQDELPKDEAADKLGEKVNI